jgi:hypothetical protein
MSTQLVLSTVGCLLAAATLLAEDDAVRRVSLCARCRSGGIDRIVIDPARRFVTVSGHEGIVRYEGFESKRVVDEDWLAERARTVRELIRK